MNKKLFTSAALWHHGLVLTRIFAGIMILPYGLEVFNASAMNNLANFLTDIHFFWPSPMAYLAKITELVGGILLIAGLFTRIITIPLSVCMIVVVFTMGGGNMFNDQTAFLFLLLFVSFFLTGPGKWSLDYFLFDRKRIQLNQNR